MPHAAAANLTKTGTTRVVFFASNILEKSHNHKGWQNKHVRIFFLQMALKRGSGKPVSKQH